MAAAVRPTLTGKDYTSMEIFELERERVFHAQWFYVGRDEQLDRIGDRLVCDVAGESVLVVRNRDKVLRAYNNVCRHRGAQLCAESGSGYGGAITCPYHAWSYSLDGALVATPNVDKLEVNRDDWPLWEVAVDSWQGFVFVNLAESPDPLLDWLAGQLDSPLSFDRFDLASLKIVHTTVDEVSANWKVIIENYSECLHCPQVHPELVELIPTYKSGVVEDPSRDDMGVYLAGGANAYSTIGHEDMPEIDGMSERDSRSYYGAAIAPNMLLDITASSVTVQILMPQSPGHTRVLTDYLFTSEAVAAPDFDPTNVIEFNELVNHQDIAVCEQVQRGVSSRAFTHGIFTEKGSAAYEFGRRYLEQRGELPVT